MSATPLDAEQRRRAEELAAEGHTATAIAWRLTREQGGQEVSVLAVRAALGENERRR